jgi:hypothetical protein
VVYASFHSGQRDCLLQLKRRAILCMNRDSITAKQQRGNPTMADRKR